MQFRKTCYVLRLVRALPIVQPQHGHYISAYRNGDIIMITVDTLSGRHNAHSGAGMFSGLLNAIKGLADGWRGYTAFKALNDLDDAALAARGLIRSDLPRLALIEMQRRG
jgi:hypothetical protein